MPIEFYCPKEKGKAMEEEGDEAEDEEDLMAALQNTRIPDHDPASIKDDRHNQILPKIVQNLIKKRLDIKAEMKNAKDQL